LIVGPQYLMAKPIVRSADKDSIWPMD